MAHQRTRDAVVSVLGRRGLGGQGHPEGHVIVTSVGPYPVIVVHDGVTVRAFHNVCPHRGHPICETDGQHKRLRCPYHHWTFALDGQRLRRPDPEDFADDGR